MEAPKKANRKPNWTSDECLSLVQLVESNKAILRGKFSSRVTAEQKRRTWAAVTVSLNASHPHVIRSVDDIEKKWYNLLSKSKQEIANYRRGLSGTGGGPSTAPLSAVATTVESILGESNVSISGIDSGSGLDTSMLQFINISSFESSELQNEEPVAVPVSVSTVPVSASLPVSLPFTLPGPDSTKSELEVKVLKAQLEYYELKIKKMKKEQ